MSAVDPRLTSGPSAGPPISHRRSNLRFVAVFVAVLAWSYALYLKKGTERLHAERDQACRDCTCCKSLCGGE